MRWEGEEGEKGRGVCGMLLMIKEGFRVSSFCKVRFFSLHIFSFELLKLGMAENY